MAITDKTRKTLWARSGNRCAFCRRELVAERNEHNRSLNLGDECHIISEQQNGPRYDSGYLNDHDDYDNLILLCKNHHRTIDELWENYTADSLRTIKANHEKWVSIALGNANTDQPAVLPRIRTGKQIVDIIWNSHIRQFDHDNLESQEDADYISGFLQNLQDWADISGMDDSDVGKQVQLGFELNNDIKELEQRGFFVFGERKRRRFKTSDQEDLGVWDVAVILVLRKDNPAILSQ